MKIQFVDLRAQYCDLKNEIDNAISAVLNETAFIGGRHVNEFKRNFEMLYGVDHCVPLANGTDALYVAMKMLEIGPGDEVITTASSWISTSETISQTGARPVFVDIDDFYTIDASKVEEKITSRTKAIIPVHLYGQMADMETVMQIAECYRLYVIEDCAQSHFSSLNGRFAGLWGDVGTFSFYPGKNLGAYGDAGCLITNNTSLASKCQRYANHGALVKHQHEVEGINSRMDGLQAAILNVKIEHILEWNERRKLIGQLYKDKLRGITGITLPSIREGSEHSFHIFGIKTDRRDDLKEFLNDHKIPSQIHYPRAMPFMPAYAYQNAKIDDYPGAYDLQCRELSLPIYPEMDEEMVSYITDHIIRFFK